MRVETQKRVLKRMVSRIYVERGKPAPFPDKETQLEPGEMGEFYVHLYVNKKRISDLHGS